MFPWDCVFPTATQAPGQPCEVLSVNIPLWEAVGDEVRARTQNSGRSRLGSKKLCCWTNAFPAQLRLQRHWVNSVCLRAFHRGAGQDAAGSPSSCVLQEGGSHTTLAQLALWRQLRQTTHQSATQCNCREDLNKGLPTPPLGELNWRNHFGQSVCSLK